jgi:nicotinamidase-related amidase
MAMAKDRLDQACRYLEKKVEARQLGSLTKEGIGKLERYAKNVDRIRGGSALSLNWSWYNKRPAEEVRQAIRAYLLASIYAGDLNADQAAGEAARVKNLGQDRLLTDITSKLRRFLGELDLINTRAMLYRAAVKGGGQFRAKAVCDPGELPVESEMERLMRADASIAIVLIDMQTDNDVGQRAMYAGKTVLQHQQDVLKAAAALKMIIYDIVIDDVAAKAFGHATTELAGLPGERKQEILARQRRDSYVGQGKFTTVSVLRDLYRPGGLVRHIPKPSHSSFVGTLFADHLRADGIKTVVVMGYDANQCIKATVFGVPSTTWNAVDGPDPTPDEILKVMQANKKLTQAEATLRAAKKTKQIIDPYVQGLLDRDISVLTSRAVLASSNRALESEWAMLAGLV